MKRTAGAARRHIHAAAPIILAAALSAGGAQRFVETFAGGASGWTSQVDAAGTAIGFGDGAAVITFGAQGFPSPALGTLVASNTASAGSLTGSYAAAGIQLLGFDVIATGAVPSQVFVEIEGPAGVLRRSFAGVITRTGLWYQVAAALPAADAGGWNESAPGCAAGVLTDVRRVSLSVSRSGTAAQASRVDNFYLTGLPRGTSLRPPGGTAGETTWTDLCSNLVYALQAADAADGGWTDLVRITATGAEHTIQMPPSTNGGSGCYRLVQ